MAASFLRRAPDRPPCRYGLSCYRKSLEHWQEFDHPPDHAFILPSSAGAACLKRPQQVIDLSDDDDDDTDSAPAKRQNASNSTSATTTASATESNHLLANLRREREERHGAPPIGATTHEPTFGFRLSALNECWVNAGLVSPVANESTVSLSAMLGTAALAGVRCRSGSPDLWRMDYPCPACRCSSGDPGIEACHHRPPSCTSTIT